MKIKANFDHVKVHYYDIAKLFKIKFLGVNFLNH
jgi:hypothetical protein